MFYFFEELALQSYLHTLKALCFIKKKKKKSCVGQESNPGQLLGRQLCSTIQPTPHSLMQVKLMFYLVSLIFLGSVYT